MCHLKLVHLLFSEVAMEGMLEMEKGRLIYRLVRIILFFTRRITKKRIKKHIYRMDLNIIFGMLRLKIFQKFN